MIYTIKYLYMYTIKTEYANEKQYCCCSVVKSYLILSKSRGCSTPDFLVLQCFPVSQIPVHWVDDAMQSSHTLSPPSPLVLNLSQHQDLFQ